MAKKIKQPSFEDALASLRGYKFDVSSPGAVANHGLAASRDVSPLLAKFAAATVQVGKYGCAAVLVAGTDTPAAILVKPGVVINGEIGHVLDRGYQKFIKTPNVERPATAEHLRAMHKFSEELRQAIGGISLYNESMGSVSDEYVYDRVKGRTLPEEERPVPAWEKPVGPGTPGEVS